MPRMHWMGVGVILLLGGTALCQAPATQRGSSMPDDLAKALARDKRSAAAWERLSFTARKEIARSLEEAKKAETRERRLAAALERLRAS